jgi:hypothetical protein
MSHRIRFGNTYTRMPCFAVFALRLRRLPITVRGDIVISLADALMSAFAMFSLKDASLLAFERRRQPPQQSQEPETAVSHRHRAV